MAIEDLHGALTYLVGLLFKGLYLLELQLDLRGFNSNAVSMMYACIISRIISPSLPEWNHAGE